MKLSLTGRTGFPNLVPVNYPEMKLMEPFQED
jgi:hypothetical protein